VPRSPPRKRGRRANDLQPDRRWAGADAGRTRRALATCDATVQQRYATRHATGPCGSDVQQALAAGACSRGSSMKRKRTASRGCLPPGRAIRSMTPCDSDLARRVFDGRGLSPARRRGLRRSGRASIRAVRGRRGSRTWLGPDPGCRAACRGRGEARVACGSAVSGRSVRPTGYGLCRRVSSVGPGRSRPASRRRQACALLRRPRVARRRSPAGPDGEATAHRPDCADRALQSRHAVATGMLEGMPGDGEPMVYP